MTSSPSRTRSDRVPATNRSREMATAMRRAVFLITIFAIIGMFRDRLIQWEIEGRWKRENDGKE